MATGVEIAGLVLAVIPLLISAFEHYNDTKGVLQKFFHKSLYIKRLIGSLDEQRVLIENELENILSRAGCRDLAVKVSLSSYHDLLQNVEVAEGFKETLGRSYSPYIRALKKCEVSVIEIAKSIKGLMRDPNFTLQQLANMAIDLSVKSRGFEFRNRLKIALNVNDVERSIKELDAATNMMARLRISGQQSDYYETSPSHSAAKLANFLNKVRMHAAQLHSAISHCWTSNCHSGHAARFYLEDRHECVKKKRTDLQFRILFGDQGTAGSYTCFSNTLVHVRLQDEPSCEADYTSIGNTQIGMPSSQQAATGRTVAFSPPIQTQARSVALRNLPSRSPGDVVDLCLELQQSQRNAAVLELYLPPGAGLRALQVTANATPRSVTTSSISDAPVSLGEVLRWYSEASSNDRARVWNFQQRMALAAKVASSALQLGSTRWLSDSWSAGQVLFDGLNTLTSPGGNAVPRFDATSPFLVTKFSANRVDADNEQDAATDLVEVGIRLLEIWHGKQLEVFARESGIALTPSQRLRREAAGQWLEQTEQDILPFYLRPIAYCLEAPTSRLFRNPDWTDTEFHRLVCEFVVQPLFSGCTATML